MKNWFLYIIVNLIEGLANLATTIFSALIVIALYKTASTMQVNDLLKSIAILEHNTEVLKMFYAVLLTVCVRSVCVKLKRPFEKIKL